MKKIVLILSCLFLLFGCGGEKTITFKEYSDLKNPEKFTGTIKEMNGDTIVLLGRFVNGKKQGEFIEYFDDMKHIDYYEDGLLNGESIVIRDGEKEPISITNYVKGKHHGKAISEFAILNYEDGELHGVQIRKSSPFPNSIQELVYYHGTIIKSKTIFDVNDLDGKTLDVESNFNIIYDGRKPVAKESFYYNSGNIRETIFLDKNNIKIWRETYQDIESSRPKSTTYDVFGNILTSN